MLLARRAAARACEPLEGILPQMHAYGEDAAELLRSARPRNDDAIDAHGPGNFLLSSREMYASGKCLPPTKGGSSA